MIDIDSVVADGKATYETLKPTLTVKYPGKYAAIDPISKEYFIGGNIAEAVTAGKAKYPYREFYAVKIGETAAISFRK